MAARGSRSSWAGSWRLAAGTPPGGPGSPLTGASCVLAALSLAPTLQLVPAGVVFAPRFLYLPLLFGVVATGAWCGACRRSCPAC